MYLVAFYTVILLGTVRNTFGVEAVPSCKHGKYDFSPLKGKSFSVSDGANGYI